jgi:hypothetical protein
MNQTNIIHHCHRPPQRRRPHGYSETAADRGASSTGIVLQYGGSSSYKVILLPYQVDIHGQVLMRSRLK